MNQQPEPTADEGLGHWSFRLLAGVPHVVTSRHGGVSPAPFDSLNLSLAVGDELANVAENRRRALALVGALPSDAVFARQVHGTRVLAVTDADAGRWTHENGATVPECDGLVTATPGVWLALTFADCVPILLYDPAHRVIGAAHGGWKGTTAGVARCAVDAMVRAFGSEPAELLVGIGPSIGPCCYEVGAEVVAAAEAGLPDPSRVLSMRDGAGRPGHAHLDLWEANRSVLLDAGVRVDRIEESGICTSCHRDRFFSHRGDRGRSGRFAAIIGLRGES